MGQEGVTIVNKDPFLDAWCAFLSLQKNFSQHTISSYCRDVRQFLSFLSCAEDNFSNDIRFEDISVTHIRMFLSSLHRQGCSNRSIGRKLSSLRSFFRFLLSEGYITNDPVSLFRNPKVEKKLPVFLTEAQVEQLLSMNYPKDFLGIRDKAIMEVLYSTGIRVGELVTINLTDIDLKNGYLRVIGKGRRERIAMLGRYAVLAIKQYLPEREKIVVDNELALFVNRFGQKMTSRAVQYMVRKRMIEAGIWRVGMTVHTLRHSFATHLLNRGANIREVQELLGHKNLITTQIYTHLAVDKMREIYDVSHPHAR